DNSGSDAWATDAPNRLMGSTWSSCAYPKLDAPPSPASVPSKVSINPENCATPAPMRRGSHATTTSRTPDVRQLNRTASPPSARRHAGSCTPTCNTAPATVPQARAYDSRESRSGSGSVGLTSHVAPATSAAMPATFQRLCAAYDRKNLRCVLRTPKHHAEITISPDMGK